MDKQTRLFDGLLWLAIGSVLTIVLPILGLSTLWLVSPIVIYTVYQCLKWLVKKLLQKFIHFMAKEIAKVNL